MQLKLRGNLEIWAEPIDPDSFLSPENIQFQAQLSLTRQDGLEYRFTSSAEQHAHSTVEGAMNALTKQIARLQLEQE